MKETMSPKELTERRLREHQTRIQHEIRMLRRAGYQPDNDCETADEFCFAGDADIVLQRTGNYATG